MAKGNDGIPTQNWPYPRVGGQDKKHFKLGTSDARPAAGYWAGLAGLLDDQQIEDAIAGLSDEREIERKLIKLFHSHDIARYYMTWHKKD
jgi:hypothetical protein